MLTTVEAEIDTKGNVRLLEPVEVKQTTRAIVTLLEETIEAENKQGSSEKLLALLNSSAFKNRKSYSDEEIEEQIREARGSWNNENLS